MGTRPPIRTLTRAEEASELRHLTADLAQLVLDITGFVDPTPASDGLNALISLGRGDWLGAGLSGIAMVPYIGDIAKAGKFPKYLKTVERAIVLAQQSERARNALLPVFRKLDQAFNLMPSGVSGQLDNICHKIRDFLKQHGATRIAARTLPDISRNFTFRTYREGDKIIQEASGRLGVPGKVRKHEGRAARRRLSKDTGEDAGHLIGARFGAPDGPENLTLQNREQNQWGAFSKVEDDWDTKLQRGIGIEVKVTAIYRKSDPTRPFYRNVEWVEIHPNGARVNGRVGADVHYLNNHSPLTREKQGLVPPTPQGPGADVIDLKTRQRRP